MPIELLNFTIILSHANSALNPFLYAYHLKEFRLAMKNALLALCGKLCCGLVNAHVDKENPLGPMSRSLTMPSIGHVTTIPNPHTGKVSIKFRKIGRTDIADCRSVQISPTKQHTNKNLNSMMIPMVVNGTPSRDNLLRTAGGTDKSLTNLSLASDSSNQLLGIPLQQITTTTSDSSSPKTNGCGRTHKCNNGRNPPLHNQLSMPQLSLTATELMVSETAIGNGKKKKGKDESVAHCNNKSVNFLKSESCSSLPTPLLENTEQLEIAALTMGNDENNKEAFAEGTANSRDTPDGEESQDIEQGMNLHDGTIEIGADEEKLSCNKLSPPSSPPPATTTKMILDESQMNSHSDQDRSLPCVDITAVKSSHNNLTSPETDVLNAKLCMTSQPVQAKKHLQEQQQNNFDFLPESQRVSLDG